MQTSFKEKVLAVVRGIKKGEVMSYKEVGDAAGVPYSARAVGNILRLNTDKNIPCHRVVHSDGNIGDYNRLRGDSKMNLLKNEGVRFRGNKVVLD